MLAAAKRILLAVATLWVTYAAVMIVLHPRFLYPFSPEPFAHPSYQRHDLPEGPSVYAHDAGQGAPWYKSLECVSFGEKELCDGGNDAGRPPSSDGARTPPRAIGSSSSSSL